jgi:enoyl-[acyl-carrier-protein] reductase (NADH)
MVVFLFSDGGAYVTGHTILVDGGANFTGACEALRAAPASVGQR